MKKRKVKILSEGESSRTITKLAQLIRNRPFWKELSVELKVEAAEKMLLAIFDLLMVFKLCKSVLKPRRRGKKRGVKRGSFKSEYEIN